MERLFSIEESAEKLGGLSPHTLRQWLSRGKLQRTKVGRRTMIRESQLLKVLQDGGKTPVPSRSRPITPELPEGSEAA